MKENQNPLERFLNSPSHILRRDDYYVHENDFKRAYEKYQEDNGYRVRAPTPDALEDALRSHMITVDTKDRDINGQRVTGRFFVGIALNNDTQSNDV